jgi:hypothetical protein
MKLGYAVYFTSDNDILISIYSFFWKCILGCKIHSVHSEIPIVKKKSAIINVLHFISRHKSLINGSNYKHTWHK